VKVFLLIDNDLMRRMLISMMMLGELKKLK
jgi:hypothetical protein